MNKNLSICLLSLFFSACMDDVDDPVIADLTAENVAVTAPVDSMPAVNTTLYDVKERYASYLSTNNTWTEVTRDLVFEAVVVANDISGNLYQTLLLRDIDTTRGTDACLVLAVKNSCLFPYFSLGQRIRVNLNGLYIGNYSYVPRIGQPYWTSVITTGSSTGNYRLGPVLFECLRTHVALIGSPNTSAPELTPRDFTSASGELWLTDYSNQNYRNCPMLGRVRGYIKEMYKAYRDIAESGEYLTGKEPLPKIFAPEVLEDQGYGVDRTLMLLTQSGRSVSIRTSTGNDISFLPLPADTCSYTGMLSYYSGWQIQLRDTADIQHITQ